MPRCVSPSEKFGGKCRATFVIFLQNYAVLTYIDLELILQAW